MIFEFNNFIAFYLVGEEDQLSNLFPWKIVDLPSGIEPIDYLKEFDLSEDEVAVLYLNNKPVAVRNWIKENEITEDEIEIKECFKFSFGT